MKKFLLSGLLLLVMIGVGDCDTIDATRILSSLRDKWSKVQSIEYDLKSEDHVTEEFKKAAGYKEHDRDLVTVNCSFQLKGADFAWNTISTLSSGVQEANSKGSIHGGMLSMLMKGRGGNPILVCATQPKFMVDTPVAGYNPVTDPFAFLDPEKLDNRCPATVLLSELAAVPKWQMLPSLIGSVTEEAYDSKPCIKILFHLSPDQQLIVYFSENDDYAPIYWQQYNHSDLRKESRVLEYTKVPLSGGEFISLPKHLEVTTYVVGEIKANIRDQFCTNFKINSEISDDAFTIDPSEANLIYDRDHNVWSKVPR